MEGEESAAAEAELAEAGIAFETLMTKPGAVIFEDDLGEIREGWSAGNGEWVNEEGALLGKELAADNHGATFKRALPLKDAVIPAPGSSPKDQFMHFLNVPWKLMFAIVPPPGMCGGYPCFVGALFMIGVQVILISDFATLMG